MFLHLIMCRIMVSWFLYLSSSTAESLFPPSSIIASTGLDFFPLEDYVSFKEFLIGFISHTLRLCIFIYLYKIFSITLYSSRWENTLARHPMLASKNPRIENGLSLFELLANGIMETAKHYKLLPTC